LLQLLQPTSTLSSVEVSSSVAHQPANNLLGLALGS
jgi:hypothetical protein